MIYPIKKSRLKSNKILQICSTDSPGIEIAIELDSTDAVECCDQHLCSSECLELLGAVAQNTPEIDLLVR